MRASRLLAILIMLQLRTRVTAEALAHEFEVSVRTIYRDVDALSAAGVPVYGDSGPGGGFQLLGGYRTHLTGLDRDEREAMFMIGLPGAADAIGVGSATERARAKLLAALPAASLADAGRISARFHLDSVDWYQAREETPHLKAVARAVLDQHPVMMTYDSWTGTRDWRIEPLGLVMKGAAWYVVANARGKFRTFRVAGILTLAIDEVQFERPEFNLAQHWAEELTRFEAGLRPLTALLRASPLGLKRLAQSGAYAAEAVRQAVGEEWKTLSLPYENDEQAALLLLGLGPTTEVLEPPALRAMVHDMAQQIAAGTGAMA